MEEYFKKRECDYWREFQPAYGVLDVKGKTVVVVGADCGSTHLWLVLRGAKYVIGYEREEKLRKMYQQVCKEHGICDKGEMRGEWRGDYPDADVFLMDCEGCEKGLDVSRLKKYRSWCVGVHDWTEDRVRLMRSLMGTTFTYVSDDGREVTLCHMT